MTTDLTQIPADADDLTIQVVRDNATGCLAIGLTGEAAHALFTLLDMVDTQMHELVDNWGMDVDDAAAVSTVAGSIYAGLRKQLHGY